MSGDQLASLDTIAATRCLTIRELAKRWRCRPSRIRKMIKDGKLAAIQFEVKNGKPKLRITPEEIHRTEQGPLAVRPKVRRRRVKIDPEILEILGSP